MKQKFNTIFLLIIAQTIAANFLFGQSAPPGIPYQAIARNANGTPYVNANLTVRFSLHEQTATGTLSYAETKSLQTNDLGLFSTTFGSGTPITGTFAGINWAQTTKFLQVEINLGSAWVDMGTQQLMSVPYAMYAANVDYKPIPVSNSLLSNITGAFNGQLAYNADNGSLYYWNGIVWVKLAIASCPTPTLAIAGSNQNPLNYSTVILNANNPTVGIGKWSIANGLGGNFSDVTNPNSTFQGLPNTNYTLKWVVSTLCDSSISYLNVNLQNNIILNNSGSWSVPPGIDSVMIELIGAGGSGEPTVGPCGYYGCWYKQRGGGGGGLGRIFMSTQGISVLNFTVGQGITNGDGGNTNFQSYTAFGGKKGANGGNGGNHNCPSGSIGSNGGASNSGGSCQGDYANGGQGNLNYGHGGSGGFYSNCGSPQTSNYNGLSGAVVITPLD